MRKIKLVLAVVLAVAGCLTGDNDSLEVECGVEWPSEFSSLGPKFGDFAVEWRCQTPGFCDAELDQGATLTTAPGEGLRAWLGLSFGGTEMRYLDVTQRANGCLTSDGLSVCPRSSIYSPKRGSYAFDAYLVTYERGRERWIGCAR